VTEWKAVHMIDKVVMEGDFNIAPNSWLDRLGYLPEANNLEITKYYTIFVLKLILLTIAD